ncbi:MAG: hypothetical protein PHF37_11050, partial [Phycisphaerae bacterium]|nr:hypothetical protein [Phycisphaerae bacterium]
PEIFSPFLRFDPLMALDFLSLHLHHRGLTLDTPPFGVLIKPFSLGFFITDVTTTFARHDVTVTLNGL